MQLGRTALIHFASLVLKSVAGFVATLYIARELGAGALGIYAVVTAMVAWSSIPSSAIDRAMEKRMSEGGDVSASLGAGLVMNGIVSVVLAVVALIGRGPINAYVGFPAADILAVLFVLNTLYWTAVSGLRGQKRVAVAGIAQVINQSARTVVQIGLVAAGIGITGVLLGHGVSLLLAAVVAFVWYEVRPTPPSVKDLKSLYEFARYSWLNLVQSRAISSVDTIVLALFVQSSLVGIYQVTWTLASMLYLFSNSIRSTLFPEVSELSADADYDRIRHLFDEAIAYSGLFVIPGLFGAALLGDRVLRIYSPEFTQGASILLILIVARLLTAYGEQCIGILNAIDRPDITFRINAAFIASNLCLNVVLVSEFGWFGAAFATAVSTGAMFVLGLLALKRELGGLTVPYGELGREVAASAAMAVVVYGLEGIAPPSNIATVVLVGAGAAVYAAAIVALSRRLRQKVRTLVPVVAA